MREQSGEEGKFQVMFEEKQGKTSCSGRLLQIKGRERKGFALIA